MILTWFFAPRPPDRAAGPGGIPFVVSECGAIGQHAMSLLRDVAKASCRHDPGKRLADLKAELQHLVLGTIAAMAQAARCTPRTA